MSNNNEFIKLVFHFSKANYEEKHKVNKIKLKRERIQILVIAHLQKTFQGIHQFESMSINIFWEKLKSKCEHTLWHAYQLFPPFQGKLTILGNPISLK